MTTSAPKHRILWADDEIDLLKPHMRFLEGKGYEVVGVLNGEDALARVKSEPFDAVLLDETMPGMGGIATLRAIKDLDPSMPVVLITKNEEEPLLEEAIGRRIDDYLVKPVNPTQVFSTLKRLTERTRIEHGAFTRDYVSEFNRLQGMRMGPLSQEEWPDLYRRVTDLELTLSHIEDEGLRQAHADMKRELNRDFGRFIEKQYPEWVRDPKSRPMLSTDLVPRHVVPHLDPGHTVYLIVIDCMRLDQWLVIQHHLAPHFRIELDLYYSVLPSASSYSRNALFSGLLPADMASRHPDWWLERAQGGGKNRFEAEFLSAQLERLGNNNLRTKYLKIHDEEGEQDLRRDINTYAGIPLVAMVFGFLDQITHGRAESSVLRELAPTESAFRAILDSWFQHSALFEVLKKVAVQNATVILTSDHGAIQARHSTLVHGNRDTSTNLRYKHGANLRADDKDAIRIMDPKRWGLPDDFLNKNYLLAREDRYFVYPTHFHEYERLYLGSFQHGGVSMEEVILPCAILRPRPAGA
jgi:CheY-like chemotaxis protein